jgi:hypothetical protein
VGWSRQGREEDGGEGDEGGKETRKNLFLKRRRGKDKENRSARDRWRKRRYAPVCGGKGDKSKRKESVETGGGSEGDGLETGRERRRRRYGGKRAGKKVK